MEWAVADGEKESFITFSVYSLVCFDSQSAMCQRFGNMPKACPYVMVSFFLWGVGLEDFGAEGVVVAEVFEVGGGGVGFEGGGVGGEGVVAAHHTL